MFCLNFRNFTAWFNYTASLKRDPVQPGCGMKNKRQSKTMLRKHVVFHCSSCVHRETTYPDLTWPFKKLCHGRFLRMGRTAKAPGIFALKVCIRLLLNGVGDHTFINLIIIKSNNTESSQTVITVSHSFNISYCLIRSSAGAVPDHAHAHLHAQPPINHSDFSKKKNSLFVFFFSFYQISPKPFKIHHQLPTAASAPLTAGKAAQPTTSPPCRAVLFFVSAHFCTNFSNLHRRNQIFASWRVT